MPVKSVPQAAPTIRSRPTRPNMGAAYPLPCAPRNDGRHMKRIAGIVHYSYMRSLAALLLALFAAPLAAATCPFNIPVVTIPPQQINGYSWGPGIRPMNDACVTHIGIEHANDSAWYVGGQNGLYMTKNAGQTWTHPLAGQVTALL